MFQSQLLDWAYTVSNAAVATEILPNRSGTVCCCSWTMLVSSELGTAWTGTTIPLPLPMWILALGHRIQLISFAIWPVLMRFIFILGNENPRHQDLETVHAPENSDSSRAVSPALSDAGEMSVARPKLGSEMTTNGFGGIMTIYVKGSWKGWDGKTVVELTNGSTWEQAEYLYEYHYAYRPEVAIVDGKMWVEGMSRPVRVRRA
jgi:hypothetical protein